MLVFIEMIVDSLNGFQTTANMEDKKANISKPIYLNWHL